MATILRRENIFSLEFELSVGLAPIGSDDSFGWRGRRHDRVVASAGTSPQRRARLSWHCLVTCQLSLRPGRALIVPHKFASNRWFLVNPNCLVKVYLYSNGYPRPLLMEILHCCSVPILAMNLLERNLTTIVCPNDWFRFQIVWEVTAAVRYRQRLMGGRKWKRPIAS